jgi:putative salt-induced outer membrane protein YdiY
MDLFHVYAILMFPFLSSLPPATFGPTQPMTFVQARPAPKPLFSGKAELSFVNTTGNTTTQTLGTAVGFKVRPDHWLVESDSDFVRTTTDDALQAEAVSSTLRFSRAVSQRVDAYGQTRYARNAFAGLRNQYAYELGFSARLLEKPNPHRLNGELAFGYISEDRVEEEDRTLATCSTGMRYAWKLSRTSEFTQDTYFTVDMGRAGDFRVRNASSIAAALTATLSLKFSHTLMYLNQPVDGFRRTDTVNSAALVARF